MKFKCKKCGHIWLPRTSNPKECPNCKSRKWNVYKKLKGGKKNNGK